MGIVKGGDLAPNYGEAPTQEVTPVPTPTPGPQGTLPDLPTPMPPPDGTPLPAPTVPAATPGEHRAFLPIAANQQ